MIYHYTDRATACAIVASGVIRPAIVAVYDTAFGAFTGPPTRLDPAIWFTVAATPSATVLTRLLVDGVTVRQPGAIWRFGVAPETAPDDLEAWAADRGYPAALFRWMVATAAVVGESWEDWRLSSSPVPRDQWLCVQSLHAEGWRDESL